MDQPGHAGQKVVTIPKRGEIQGLPDGNQAVSPPAIEPARQSDQIGLGESEMSDGLNPPVDQPDQVIKPIQPRLLEQSAANA